LLRAAVKLLASQQQQLATYTTIKNRLATLGYEDTVKEKTTQATASYRKTIGQQAKAWQKFNLDLEELYEVQG
jgi:hypothetical protein